MKEAIQENKGILAAVLVIGIAATAFASTQTSLLNSVTGETNSHSGDAMEAGDAMKAQEDLGSTSGEAMDSEGSMNDSMMDNDSMEQ